MRSSGWHYAAAAAPLAAIAAVISYRDGLFVARLAGNHDGQAFLYPFLPDGLIVVCLVALYEASRAKVARSRWAMAGLVLGIVLTLAQNVYAGQAHSPLDAVLDGMVPVVFFITVEAGLWHVKRGRGAGVVRHPGSPAAPSSSVEAAAARMAEARDRGFRYSNNEAAADYGLTRAQVTELRRQITEEDSHGQGQVRVRAPHRESDQGHQVRRTVAAAAAAEGRQGEVGAPAGVPAARGDAVPAPAPAGVFASNGSHG
jgi:hypothetical protein